jgi:hypothetical protein
MTACRNAGIGIVVLDRWDGTNETRKAVVYVYSRKAPPSHTKRARGLITDG